MDHSDALIRQTVSPANLAFYRQQGYLIAPRLFSEEQIARLRAEATAIVLGQRGNVKGAEATQDQLPEDELLRKYAAIHFPHKISPLMKETAADPAIAQHLSQLVSDNVKCLQTMLFLKAPGKKGQSWHQDEYFIPTRDRSLTGAWIALENADVDNGCLWVIPGSQRDGIIRRRVPNTDQEFADVETIDPSPYTEADFVPVEVDLGSVVYFNGYLLHMSRRNRSVDRFRRALVAHYCSAESMLPWDQDGRQEPTEDFRDIFMVAGQDPYAHKGTVELSEPFVRPDVLAFKLDNR